jgi:hypothetical protein
VHTGKRGRPLLRVPAGVRLTQAVNGRRHEGGYDEATLQRAIELAG